MIEIQDTFQDAEIETPKASRGVRYGDWGGGIALPIRLGGLREHCKLPQRGPGQSPAENEFGVFCPQQNTSLTGKNVKMINCNCFMLDTS